MKYCKAKAKAVHATSMRDICTQSRIYPTRVFKRREPTSNSTSSAAMLLSSATYTQQPTPEHKRHLRVGVARPQLPAKQKGGASGVRSGGRERHLRCMGHTGAGWSDARSSTVKERNPHLACLTRVMSNQSSSEPISPSVRGSHRVCCAAGVLCCWGAGAGERAGYPEPNDHSPHCQRRGLG